MDRYACSFAGHCEADHNADLTQEQCRSTCRPLGNGRHDLREVAYEVLSYDLIASLQASPSDRVALIRRMTGITVIPDHSYALLRELWNQDYNDLFYYESPLFHPYLRRVLGDYQFTLLSMLDYQDDGRILNWRAFVNNVDIDLTELFRGRRSWPYSVPPSNYDSLIEGVQDVTVEIIKGNAYDSSDRESARDTLQANWSLFLDRFGTDLPFTSLLPS